MGVCVSKYSYVSLFMTVDQGKYVRSSEFNMRVAGFGLTCSGFRVDWMSDFDQEGRTCRCVAGIWKRHDFMTDCSSDCSIQEDSARNFNILDE
jgi:hypothetical protein